MQALKNYFMGFKTQEMKLATKLTLQLLIIT